MRGFSAIVLPRGDCDAYRRKYFACKSAAGSPQTTISGNSWNCIESPEGPSLKSHIELRSASFILM